MTAIVHGNEWRDISEDARAGIVTLSSRFGKDAAYLGYMSLILGAYVTLGVGVAVGLAAGDDDAGRPGPAVPGAGAA